MTSLQSPSANAPPQGRNSVFTKSPTPSAQNAWGQQDYYNIAPTTMGESYLAALTSLSFGSNTQPNPIGASSPRDHSIENCPSAGNGIIGDSYNFSQARQSPRFPSQGSSLHEPVALIPVSGQRGIADLTAGYPPFATKRPPTPPPRVPFSSPQESDSVFTYSPPPAGQSEWEQYYYYPDGTQNVTPGHDMGDTYIETGSSPSVGLRRRRHTEYADTHQGPQDTMGECYLPSPPRSAGLEPFNQSPSWAAVPPGWASVNQPPPRAAATRGRKAYALPSPPKSSGLLGRSGDSDLPFPTPPEPLLPSAVPDRQDAAARSKLLPSATGSRGELLYSRSKDGFPLAGLPPGRVPPQSRTRFQPLSAPTSVDSNLPFPTSPEPLLPSAVRARQDAAARSKLLPSAASDRGELLYSRSKDRFPLAGLPPGRAPPQSRTRFQPLSAPTSVDSNLPFPTSPEPLLPSAVRARQDAAARSKLLPSAASNRGEPLYSRSKDRLPLAGLPPGRAPPESRTRFQPLSARTSVDSNLPFPTSPEPLLPSAVRARQDAAARSKLLPSATGNRGELLYSRSKDRLPLAGLPPGRAPPESRTRFQPVSAPQGQTSTSGFPPDGRRRTVHVDYTEVYGPTPPSPEANPIMRDYVDPDSGQQKKRPVPYASLLELEDSKLYSALRESPAPNPKRKADVGQVQKRSRSRKGGCCQGVSAHTYEDKEGNVIVTSSPQISTTRFGLASVSPIRNADEVTRFYDIDNASVLETSRHLDNKSCSLSEAREDTPQDKFQRAYLQKSSGRLDISSLGTGKAMDYSKIPPPDFSKIMSQFRRAPPVKPVGAVKALNGRTYPDFIGQQDLVVVMFHDSKTDPPGTLASWSTHSLKTPGGINPTFASVDCGREQNLCASEGINTSPFYKMYSRGYLVNAVKDIGLMSY